jgi:hypothetical protein
MLKSILGFENWTKKCPKSKNRNTFQLFSLLTLRNTKIDEIISFSDDNKCE